MTTPHDLRRTLTDERGSVLVVAGLLTLAIVLLATVIIEVGHVMEHRRHLQAQADAAALAAALEFPLCTTDPASAFGAMSTVADKYGGFGGASSYNQQVGTGTYGGTVESAYQQRDYPPGGTAHAPDPDNIFGADTTTLTCGDPAVPNSSKMFDVKATEFGIKNVFDFGLFSTVHAHARVNLRVVNEKKGLLPLAVPDVRPNFVFATFIAETGTISCKDQSGNTVASCDEQLVKASGPPTGNSQSWVPAQPLQVTVPTGDLGVRIRLIGGDDPAAQCGDQYVECYDAGSTNGLVHVRGWNSAAVAPLVKDAALTPGTTCTPDAYFTNVDCSAGITANVDLGAAHPVERSKVWATVDGSGTYQLTVDPANPTGTGLHTWTLSAGLPITGGGPHEVRLKWQDTGPGCSGTCSGNFGGQLIQRAFEATPDRSGPLPLVQVYETGTASGPFSYSYPGNTTHSLNVTVTTLGNLLLSGKWDPPIYLRVFKDNGGSASQNQSLDCDPAYSNLKDEIHFGCSPWYKFLQPGDPGFLQCPASQSALWSSQQPWTCVAIQTGASVGQISQGLNLHIYNDPSPPPSACSQEPVNWVQGEGFLQDDHPDDRRVLPLFVTPLGTFQNTGTGVVPLIDFGYFYVTGYKGDPCEGQANQDPVPNNRGSFVRGHFVKFFDNSNSRTTEENCDLQTIAPCRGVLTR